MRAWWLSAGVVIGPLYVLAIGGAWYAPGGRYAARPMDDGSTRVLGARVLAGSLVLCWAVAGLAATAIRTSEPLEALVTLASWSAPTLVALVGLRWPAVMGGGPRGLAIAAAGLTGVLLAAPIAVALAGEARTGDQHPLAPSVEMAWAFVAATLATAIFAAAGSLDRREEAATAQRRTSPTMPEEADAGRASAARIIALAGVLTAGCVLAVGIPVAVRSSTAGDGPVPGAVAGPLPACDDPPLLAPGGRIEVGARAVVDGAPVGAARLTGGRTGTDEDWEGHWTGPVGAGGLRYRRTGQAAAVAFVEGPGPSPGTLADPTGAVEPPAGSPTAAAEPSPREPDWEAKEPDPFALRGGDGLTMDGPVVALLAQPSPADERSRTASGSPGIVAEDRGTVELEGVEARHCVTFIDGPAALDGFVPLRWLVSGDPVATSQGLGAWRGELDWWVVGDGRLVRAVAAVGGLADDAWPGSGREGRLEVELRVIVEEAP